MSDESFADGLREAAFRAAYRGHLDRHSDRLIAILRQTLARPDVSPDVDHIELQAFPDASGDGVVSVCMYFEGRNRQVRKNDPSLYCGAVIELTDGLRVPLHDPDAYSFDTVDVSVAVVIDWVLHCWTEAGGQSYGLPATITGHDEYGTPDLLPLNDAGRAALEPRRRRTGRPRA